MGDEKTRTDIRSGQIGFLEKLSPGETLILAAIVMAGLAGMMLIGKGLALNADIGLL